MKLFLTSIIFLIAITAFTPFASGQTLFWSGGTSGDINVTTNWNTSAPNINLTPSTGTNGIPGPGNIAIIDVDINNGSAVDDFTAGVTNVPLNLTLKTVTSGNNVVKGLVISNYFFWNGATTGIVSIANTSAQPLTVTGSGLSTGDLLIDGAEILNFSGALKVNQGTIVIGDNLFSSLGFEPGSGTLNLTSGSLNFDPTSGQTTQMIVGNSSQSSTNNATFGTATGTVTQGASGAAALVTTGNSLILGYNGGAGTWNVTNGSTLQTGTQATSYLIALGSNGGPGTLNGTGSAGTLTISDTSKFNLGSSGSTIATDLQLGTTSSGAAAGTAGGSGTIVQNSGTVNFAGKATTVEVGDLGGGTGTYNLMAGTGNLNIGINATDAVTFTLGAGAGSLGTLNQSGGTLTVGNTAGTNTTAFIVGGAGNGIFNLNGGIANFNKALTLGATGVINLNGGVLNISAANFAPSAGALNFGNASLVAQGILGGTLKLTSGTTFTDSFGGGALATGATGTIDASVGTFTTVTIAQNLTGGGGIALVGTDGTNGNALTTFSFTGTNSYTGATTIAGGTLNATAANIENSSALNILSNNNSTPAATVSVGTLNLTLAANGLAYTGAIAGDGNLNVNFTTAGDTFAVKNTGNFTGVLTLGANGRAGNLQAFSGAFGNIGDAGSGSGVTIGGPLPAGINTPLPFTVPTSGAVTIGTATYTGLTTINPNFSLTVTGAGGLLGDVNNGGTLSTPSIGGDVTNNSGGVISVTGVAGIGGNVTSNVGTLSTTSVTGSVTNSGIFIASASANTVGGNLTNANTGVIMATSPLPAVINTPTFTVVGNMDLSTGGTGGTLIVRTNGTVADQYAVGGAATLDNGVIQVQVVGGGKIGTTTYDIVTGSSVSDAGLTLSPDTALFSYALVNAGTTENLVVTQSPIATYATTPNQKAVAAVIDGTNSPLFSFFGSIPLGAATSTIPGALEQLTPESLQYARMIAFENSNLLAQRTNGWLADLRSGYAGLDTSALSLANPGFESGLGRSLGSLLASNAPSFHQSAPNGVNYYPDGGSDGTSLSPHASASARTSEPAWDSSTEVISDSPNPYLAHQNPSGPGTPVMSEFISGDAVLADLNQSQSAANAPSSKASYTAGGATAGVSFRMTSHLAAGVLFDYTHTDAKTDSSGSKTKVDSYSPGFFATYFDHGFYVNGLFSFGYNNYSNTRNISILGDTASSSPNGQQYVGDLDFGYDFHPDKHWIVGPTLGVTYTHLDIDSFTETGAPGADLAIDSQSVDSVRSRLGGHVIFQTNTGDVLLQPNLTAMWQHEYLDNGSGITSSFSDFGSSPFTIQTAAPSRDSALIGCGMTATLSNSMALYLNYLADVGASNYFAQSVIGGFKARF